MITDITYFHKKTASKCSTELLLKKFLKIPKKTPLVNFAFGSKCYLITITFLRKVDSTTDTFCTTLQNIQQDYFQEDLLMTASSISIICKMLRKERKPEK